MRRVNYGRRQQHRRLSRGVSASSGSVAAALLALVIASAGAMSVAVCMLVLALGLGLYAPHWFSLAGRSRVGAGSATATDAPLTTATARSCHRIWGLPWHNWTSTSDALARG